MNDPAASKVSEQGVVFVRTRSYGAELSNRQFGLLIAAIALGTLLECEWDRKLDGRCGRCGQRL